MTLLKTPTRGEILMRIMPHGKQKVFPVTTGGSIQNAVNAASAGDIVMVYPGTYNEQVTMKAGVDVIGVDPRLCVINPTADHPAVTMASNTRLSGVKVLIDALWQNPGNGAASSYAIDASGGLTGVQIDNCIIEGAQWGILAYSPKSSLTIKNCLFCCPQAVYGGLDGSVMTHNTHIWNGATTNCMGLLDGEWDNSTICLNVARLRHNGTGTGQTYGLRFVGVNNYVGGNVIKVESPGVELFGIGLAGEGAFDSMDGNKYFGNCIDLVSTHATPEYVMSFKAISISEGELHIAGNIFRHKTNPCGQAHCSFFGDTNIGGTVYIDRQSLGMDTADLTIIPGGVTLVELKGYAGAWPV
jgi:hypothetical protein